MRGKARSIAIAAACVVIACSTARPSTHAPSAREDAPGAASAARAPDAGSAAPDEPAPADAPRSKLAALRVFAGHAHSCAIVARGEVYCWGKNDMGQLGDGTRTDRPLPVRVEGLRATSLALGRYHTCAITTDATATCWGFGQGGRIGDGEIEDRLVPTRVAKLTGVVRIATGDWHSCAVTRERSVFCWGAEASGARKPRLVPERIAGVVAREIAVGDLHTCALVGGGRVSCWGNADRGQLGPGVKGDVPKPRLVEGVSGAVALFARGFGACVRKGDGTVWCWGSDSGDGAPDPHPIDGIEGAIDLAVGQHHACAKTRSAGWRCWGWNRYGQVGDGSFEDREVPAATTAEPIASAQQIALGGGHGCARLADGTAACWGDDASRQLGTGRRFAHHPYPRRVVGLSSPVAIAAGDAHTCARLADGTVSCWGSNGFRQLGDGTDRDSAVPVAVKGLDHVEEIGLGAHFSCARLADRTVSCWGADLATGAGASHAEPRAPSRASQASRSSRSAAPTSARSSARIPRRRRAR
jgi:alpha-tubulin suppressor-like RCC1 family protein